MPDATNGAADEPAAEDQRQRLEGGTYEVLRARLDASADQLRQRTESLNRDRLEVFGGVETAVLANERVTTDHNCTPVDIAAIGDNLFLFGYNIQFGLKSTTDVGDVFGCYRYDAGEQRFHPAQAPFLHEKAFLDDFNTLYRFYRGTTFAKFHLVEPHLYMVMRLASGGDSYKTFKWLLRPDESPQYLGNRFDHEYVYPPQHEFEWRRAHRDMHRGGLHPHVSIEDRVFVETVGGDLTIKVEDNTDSGEGIFQEPVDNPDQTLDDADIFYAIVGNLILLRIKPYQEEVERYLVFNERTRQVLRIDTIKDSCVLLPDDQGLVFANGFLLQDGEMRTFDTGLADMRFERRLSSANGEDVLFVFFNQAKGEYMLLPYNRIARGIENPTPCHGYSVFKDGTLILFRSQPGQQAQKHHALQIWQTPFFTGEAPVSSRPDSYLHRVGNAEIVRCLAECQEILNLLRRDDSYADLYPDLVRLTTGIIDSYFWLDRDEGHHLQDTLAAIRDAARAALEEFDKVRRMRQTAAERLRELQDEVTRLCRQVDRREADGIRGLVEQLDRLRGLRGQVLSARDVRYIDLDTLGQLDTRLINATDAVSEHTVDVLSAEGALQPYRDQLAQLEEDIPAAADTVRLGQLDESATETAGGLDLLIETIGSLEIADPARASGLIESVSAIYSDLNQVRASLRRRRQQLGRAEATSQFGAEWKLLNQAVLSHLERCNTPDDCQDHLARILVRIEELEGRFGEFDEFLAQLEEKREEVYSAFEGRRQELIEARNRRANTLMQSGERIINSVTQRVGRFDNIPDITGYLASDVMVLRLRSLIDELRKLGDQIKADDLQTRLQTVQEDAVRQLRDRRDLFGGDGQQIRLGRHTFSVNTQPLELSLTPRDNRMTFHLAGTAYFEPVEHDELDQLRPHWQRSLVSEDERVYRSEFLAWKLMRQWSANGGDQASRFLETSAEAQQVELVRAASAGAYEEGYTKGIHDRDAAILLRVLLPMFQQLGLLRHPPKTRAAAMIAWTAWPDHDPSKQLVRARFKVLRLMHTTLGVDFTRSAEMVVLQQHIETFLGSPEGRHAFPSVRAEPCAGFLGAALLESDTSWPRSPTAGEWMHDLDHFLLAKRMQDEFREQCQALADQPLALYELHREWLTALQRSAGDNLPGEAGEAAAARRADPGAIGWIAEAAAHMALGTTAGHDVDPLHTSATLDHLLGQHPRIDNGAMQVDFHDFTARLTKFEAEDVPAYRRLQELKHRILETRRNQMRLDQFRAQVMTAFVRNRLIDEAYLPVIGENLAKQIGALGDGARTDRSGLLLLISPPGYGKTTLVEYVANRLGMTLVKINGPVLGTGATSLDPTQAPNASAREEVEKLNLALEMGDNVMIYLDDIQHCSAEFLQRFIPLCDAQRRIDGVFRGQSKAYDLRGRKVAVIMAGNPYTESGDKFQLPDMLANRADTYNLGDVAGNHREAFEQSYLENAVTSNPALNRLSGRGNADVRALIRIATTGSREGVDFEGNYSADEIDEMLSVMKKLCRVRDVMLTVNREYILSAAQADEYRTEPPFKLQGSYRNMNRITAKIVAVMTDAEVEAEIDDHYRNEAQNLTTGAEANLLKLAELRHRMSDEQRQRWDDIKSTFQRNQFLGGAGDNDPVSRVVGQLALFSQGLDHIREAVHTAATTRTEPAVLADLTIQKLSEIVHGLRAVPVKVDINVLPVQDEPENPAPPASVAAGQPKGKAKTKAKSKAKTPAGKAKPEGPLRLKTEVKQQPEDPDVQS